MEYKKKMLKVAKNLCQIDVENLKYIYSDIGKGILEKVTTSLKLIEVLEEHGYVAENKLEGFKKNLHDIGRTDLIEIINDHGQASLYQIEGKFPGGCVFKLNLQTDNVELTRVKFKPKEAKSKWKVINNGYQESNDYYIPKKENKVLFVKVENIKVDGEVVFKFSFQDSKGKKQRSVCCEVLIPEICNYEMNPCNQLNIVIPDPCLSNKFPWINQNPPMPEYLDWRDSTSSQYSSSKEKPILEFAEEYFKRNFVDLDQVICFPALSINEEIEDLTEKYKICILQLFTELFKNKLTKGIRALLFDYNLYHHATLLNFIPQENIERCSANRVLIFYSKVSLIFIVRVAASLDLIKQECKNCSADVKYFASINKPVIEKKALTILGVVACCSVERKDLELELTFQYSSKFDLYNTLFICQDELKTCETLNIWWRNKIFEYCSNKNSHSNNKALFKQVIGLTMLIIAKLKVGKVPTLNSDTSEQIKSLDLNPEQINAINNKELKKVIFGGFGSGKSVVGREIVERFYLKSSKKSTLYYICCDHFSLFQCEMKDFADNLKKYSKKNVEIVCENLLELWQRMCKNQKLDENKDISLPKLLQYYSENSSAEVHFVLDELPGEYVKEQDANELKKLFTSLLNQSLVVFIPQSIEKKRHLNINGEKKVLESNCFHEDVIGMKKIALEKLMRVTKCIQLLIDSAQDTISKSNTILCQNSKIKSNHEKDNHSHSIMEIQNQQKTVTNKQITKKMKTENSNFDTAQDITQQQEDDAATVKVYHDYDLDRGSKIVSNSQPDVGSNNYMETQFVFKHGVCGHSIIGEKPKVIFLPVLNWTDESSAKVLSVVLEKICFIKVRITTVICSNMDEVQLVSFAIDIIENYQAVVYSPHLQKYTPTLQEKFSVTKKIKESKQNVLVTDSRGMCGAESEVVIVIVKPEEYFLRHVVADICARCTSYLVVFVLPSENAVYRKGGTIEEVLDNWSEDIVQKIQVKITDNENQLCRLTDCSLYINNQSKDFKDRGANMNFTRYNENKRFKVNDRHNILYEKKLSDLFIEPKSMDTFSCEKLLFDIFNKLQSIEKRIKKTSDTRERKNDEEQKKIKEILMLPLKSYQKQLGELHRLLDIDDRALKICDEFDFSDRRRFEIELSKFGGGNPAKIFLESLKLRHGEKSIEYFNRVLKDSKVIWSELKKTENKGPAVLKISQLDHNNIKDLSYILKDDWKSVAIEFGYADEQIEYISRYQMRPHNYFSCSERVFRMISQEKPEYSISEFMCLLLRLKFNDVYNHMEKGVIAWAREKDSIN